MEKTLPCTTLTTTLCVTNSCSTRVGWSWLAHAAADTGLEGMGGLGLGGGSYLSPQTPNLFDVWVCPTSQLEKKKVFKTEMHKNRKKNSKKFKHKKEKCQEIETF